MAHGGPINPEKIRWGVVEQRSFIYSCIHSEIFLKHLGGGRNCAKHGGGAPSIRERESAGECGR